MVKYDKNIFFTYNIYIYLFISNYCFLIFFMLFKLFLK